MAGKSLDSGSDLPGNIFEYLSWSQEDLVQYLRSEDLDQQVCGVFQGQYDLPHRSDRRHVSGSRSLILQGSFLIVCSLSLLLEHKIDGSQIPVVSAEMLEKMGIKLVNDTR